jgi:hypothetical protein
MGLTQSSIALMAKHPGIFEGDMATLPSPARHSQPVAANTLRDRRVMSFSGRAFSYC